MPCGEKEKVRDGASQCGIRSRRRLAMDGYMKGCMINESGLSARDCAVILKVLCFEFISLESVNEAFVVGEGTLQLPASY